MKRFGLLLVAPVLAIQVTGCGGGSSPAGAVSRAENPQLPAEVREYEAKNAKRLEERAAKASAKAAAKRR